ncbi:MAG: hypothetical protein ACLFVU_07790 [Phycisphaerae bacterium]
MIEFIMCLPFIALILSLTYFFGYAMQHQQQVKVSSRYASWKRVRTGLGPNAAEINQRNCADAARDVDVVARRTPIDTALDLATNCGTHSPDARIVADDLFLRWAQRGWEARVTGEWDHDVDLWEDVGLSGPITKGHLREGVEWRRVQVDMRRTVIDLYLQDIDTALRTVNPPGDGMAGMMRSLYRHGW